MKTTMFGRKQPEASAHAGCQLETLSRSGALHVQRCAHCDTLTLHLGPISMRLDQETAEAVFTTLGHALTRLHLRREATRAAEADASENAN